MNRLIHSTVCILSAFSLALSFAACAKDAGSGTTAVGSRITTVPRDGRATRA